MKKLIAFNWKMYPKKLKDVEGIVLAFDGIDIDLKQYEIVIVPPTVYLALISEVFYKLNAEIRLALQNCMWESEGAFTGEISPDMGKQFGVDYVIIGHSERRQHFGETDEMINKKIKAALKAGLRVILCVGEPLLVRKKGSLEVKKYIKKQIVGALTGLPLTSLRADKLSIAYEPIWAISTSSAKSHKETSEDAVEVITYIKSIYNTRVLYGGSVSSKNITSFISQKEIDGALIGGASVDKKEVKAILKLLN